MMGLDTHVLVRFLVRDDEAQELSAHDFGQGHDDDSLKVENVPKAPVKPGQLKIF